MILPIVKVYCNQSFFIALAVVWIMCVRNTASQAPLPAPNFSFSSSVKANNIELYSKVQVYCEVPRSTPYPVTVFVGKLESPSQTPETTKAWMSFDLPKSSSRLQNFEVLAIAANEGKIVCWYKSTQTEVKNPYSEFSSPITLVISSLHSPIVRVTPSFAVGGNYTVSCAANPNTTRNFTMSLYYRILPAAPGTGWTFHASLYLTNDSKIYMVITNAVVPLDYTCSMEMLYNGKVLRSPLSEGQPAYPEYFQVRLLEKYGESCLGLLEVKLKWQWEPVCEGNSGNVPDSSNAAATAKVVCRELGCGGVLGWKRLAIKRGYANTVDVVRCTGDEKKFKDCQLKKPQSCMGKTLYIICSDTLPPPTLHVSGSPYGSNVYVNDKQDVEIFCSINSTHIKYSSGYYIFYKDGRELSRSYTYPVSTRSITQVSPEQNGEYECVFQLDDSDGLQLKSPPSNTVNVYIYNPPNVGAVVAGVLTTVIGVAVLVYVCVCRSTEEEVQDNVFPAQSQGPETQTHSENPCYNTNYLPQQM